MTKTLSQLKTIFTNLDQQLSQAQKDIKQLNRIKKNFTALSDYYFGDWLKDRDRLLKLDPTTDYKSLSEDSIWEIVQKWQRIK